MRDARLALRSARSASSRSSALSSTIRMSTGWLLTMIPIWPEREKECCPLVNDGVSPDPAAVPMDDALHDRKTHACALEVLRPVQTLEHSEELVRVLHVEPGGVVAHIENVVAVLAPAAHVDARRLTVAAVL